MAQELFESIADSRATIAHVRARLAELPTVTEIGMNALAPVAERGRLAPIFVDGAMAGFSTGEFRVSSPETRKRAMHDRVGGATCPMLTLEEVISRNSTNLKQTVARARLMIVHSQEIDNAGEKGVGPIVFDRVLHKLRAAWSLLRDADVRRFVFTADHGFLLLDGKEQHVPYGRKIDPKPRYVFASQAAIRKDEVRVSLAELEYSDAEGSVVFPESTAVFDTGRRARNFVHGGNSLQERVIPVLTLDHRAPAGGSTLQYAVSGSAPAGKDGDGDDLVPQEDIW